LIAQGSESDATANINADLKREILKLYSEILDSSNVSFFSAKDLRAPLLPVSLTRSSPLEKLTTLVDKKISLILKELRDKLRISF